MAKRRPLNDQLRAATAQATRQLSRWLDTRFTEEISAVKWDYPTPPQVRDIVDTGRLRASQTRTVNSDGSITFTWPVEYASQVHEGGVALSGLRFPGRPWTKAPLEEAATQYDRFLRNALRAEQT
jgi:hypothetical protein